MALSVRLALALATAALAVEPTQQLPPIIRVGAIFTGKEQFLPAKNEVTANN